MYRKHVVDGSAFITGPQPKASCELSSQNSLRKYMVSNVSKVQPEGVISPSFQKTGRVYYYYYYLHNPKGAIPGSVYHREGISSLRG